MRLQRLSGGSINHHVVEVVWPWSTNSTQGTNRAHLLLINLLIGLQPSRQRKQQWSEQRDHHMKVAFICQHHKLLFVSELSAIIQNEHFVVGTTNASSLQHCCINQRLLDLSHLLSAFMLLYRLDKKKNST